MSEEICAKLLTVPKVVLLQIIGEHELPLLEEELSHIKAITQSADFLFITVQVDSWNDDLSPWAVSYTHLKAPFIAVKKATVSMR